jgi:hypothetical protein
MLGTVQEGVLAVGHSVRSTPYTRRHIDQCTKEYVASTKATVMNIIFPWVFYSIPNIGSEKNSKKPA